MNIAESILRFSEMQRELYYKFVNKVKEKSDRELLEEIYLMLKHKEIYED